MVPLLLLVAALVSVPRFDCVITATDAVALAPQLIEQGSKLEEALAEYRSAQIEIAAVKLRSLLPVEIAGKVSVSDDSDDEDKSGPKKSDSSDSDSDDDEEVENVPTADSLLSNALESLLKSLKDEELANQIRSSPVSFSLPLAATKELEATQKLSESVKTVRLVRKLLQVPDETTPPVTAEMLAILVEKLDSLQELYDDLEDIQKRLTSAKEEKRIKARKNLAESNAKIAKIVHKIANIIE